jgi:glycosyltransferase involved in cell wall biosynthesis
LVALLRALDADATGHALLDQRFELLPMPGGMTVRRFMPSIGGRARAELYLSQIAVPTSRVVCFGSLPPLWRCRGRVSVFVQNQNIINRTDISEYPLKQRLRIALERHWFRRYSRNADRFIVQTQTMLDLLERLLGRTADISVAPLVPDELLHPLPPRDAVARGTATPYDFCYVSTGEPHKNHRRLVEAWILLARKQWFPSLYLTVSAEGYPRLHRWIDDMRRRHGLNIDNVGYVSSPRVHEIYSHSQALIYPALYESFGLPLVEACRHDLRIVAAERDYVRDVVTPDETFDPLSARSIARAAERLCHENNSRAVLVNGRTFMSGLLAA